MNGLADTPFHRIRRRLSHRYQTAVLPRLKGGPIVTFGFDDCPVSAIDTGLPILETQGWRATIYVSVGLCDTINHLGRHMSRQDIIDTHARGHEIGDHTYSHINAKQGSAKSYYADILRNQAALADLGIPPSDHFAYPFGDVTVQIKKRLRKQFKTLRGVLPPRSADQDANYLPAMPLYSGHPQKAALERIASLKDSSIWLNLFTHDIQDFPSPFGCTAEEFQEIVNAVKASGARVMTARTAFETIMAEGAAS